MRCLWRVGLRLQSNTGNQLSSPEYRGCRELSFRYFTVIDVPLDLRWASQGIAGFFQKDVKPLVVYDVECGMDME